MSGIALFRSESVYSPSLQSVQFRRRAQLVRGHMNIRATEIYLHELGVDRGVADIFKVITNQITNEPEADKEKGVTVLQ